MTVLEGERRVRRRPPANLRDGDLPLFAHDLERVLPAIRLLELCSVRASPEGLLFRRGRMLPESFAFPANRRSWTWGRLARAYAGNYLARRRRRFRGAALWAVDDWSGGYFHWLADVLPRLVAMGDRLAGLVLLLPHTYRALPFVAASLEMFPLGGTEFIERDEVLLCDTLALPTHTAPSGHHDEALVRRVRQALVGRYGGTAGPASGRVYVSRGRAGRRRIANEDEVIALVRGLGFRIVRFEEHAFAEQVAIAAGARHLVGNHGAGLTNMLFMGAGGRVLELRHAEDAVDNCYFTLASALGLEYFYQACAPVRPGESPHTADLIADVGALRETLLTMLGSGDG